MNRLQSPNQPELIVSADSNNSFEDAELLHVPTLPELASRIKICLQEDRMRQHDFDCLRKNLELSYKKCLLDAFYSGHASYCICTGAEATDIYLYRNWPASKSDRRNKKSLRQISEQIEDDLMPTRGTQITPTAVHKILALLEARYQFLQRVRKGKPLFIILPDCSHKNYNGLCRTHLCKRNQTDCEIYLFHSLEYHKYSPEFVFLHELGHVLNLALTGTLEIVPNGFLEFAEILFPNMTVPYQKTVSEIFADCFAMGIMSLPPMARFDPFGSTRFECKQVIELYMLSLITTFLCEC